MGGGGGGVGRDYAFLLSEGGVGPRLWVITEGRGRGVKMPDPLVHCYNFFKFLAYNTLAIVQGHTSLARPVHPQTPEKRFRTEHYYLAIKPILP